LTVVPRADKIVTTRLPRGSCGGRQQCCNRQIVGGLSDDAVSVHLGCEAPHLWVTSGPENLVYCGYKGNRMTIVSEASASMLTSRLRDWGERPSHSEIERVR
jgi:hypothetical protein